MPEYLNNRYKSKAIRWIMTLVALVSYVFTKISVSISCIFILSCQLSLRLDYTNFDME